MTEYDEIAENLSACYCLEIRYDHESHSFVMVHDDGREETVCGADVDLLEVVWYLDSLYEE